MCRQLLEHFKEQVQLRAASLTLVMLGGFQRETGRLTQTEARLLSFAAASPAAKEHDHT